MEPSHGVDLGDDETARAVLHACCGSTRWVERMLGRRPFASGGALLAAAEEEWRALGPDDWREAFSHHPRIGDRDALQKRFPATHHLSAQEQAGVAGAHQDVLDALAEGNRAYEEKFGYLFIVCATGLTAEEMLERLRARLPNDPEAEIRNAAREQEKITAIRLRGLSAQR
jgi:2-oxo-4-hydroxy-4-carboxy-5-ureidoimidazoline decarboxylase